MNGDNKPLMKDGHVSCDPVEYDNVPNLLESNGLEIVVVMFGIKLLTSDGIALLTSTLNGLL